MVFILTHMRALCFCPLHLPPRGGQCGHTVCRPCCDGDVPPANIGPGRRLRSVSERLPACLQASVRGQPGRALAALDIQVRCPRNHLCMESKAFRSNPEAVSCWDQRSHELCMSVLHFPASVQTTCPKSLTRHPCVFRLEPVLPVPPRSSWGQPSWASEMSEESVSDNDCDTRREQRWLARRHEQVPKMSRLISNLNTISPTTR